MRLISQDGMIDIPYQRVIVSLSFICNTEIVCWWFGCTEEEVITLGNYSTEAKALKVMEMLREKNFWDKDVFKFPDDSEVEV